MNFIGPALIVLFVAGIFYYLWNDIQKRNAVEAAREKQRKEEQAKRDAEYVRVRAQQRSQLTKPRTRSLPRNQQPTVATPRPAAPKPTPSVVSRQTYQPPVSQPAPVATQDTFGDALLGAVAGYALGSLVSSITKEDDDRPSQSCSVSSDNNEPFRSGGGGDYGGGGAESSWDSGSSVK